ncbi:MAG TPA: hypothetical protein PKE63_07845 [Lacibacter sp.]|nr:hypothetical protein [Lacibacter sp.]
MLYNQGNTNITINGNFVLTPGMSWSSPEENPEVEDWSNIDVQFDEISVPVVKAPDVGTQPVPFDTSWITGPRINTGEYRYDDGGIPDTRDNPVDPWAGFELPSVDPEDPEDPEEPETPTIGKDNRLVIFKSFVTKK